MLDLLIVVIVVAAAAVGARAGLIAQSCTVLGSLGGLVIGAWVAHLPARMIDDPEWQAAIVLTTVLSSTIAFASLGSRVGAAASPLLRRVHLVVVDAVLGALVSTAGALLTVWLFAASLAAVPQAGLGSMIHDSVIIDRLIDVMPPPPDLTSRLARLVDPLGLPRVFVELEPAPAPPLPPPADADVQAAADAASGSVVAVVGVGCGGILQGSGVVVAPDLVLTAAHVVAGVESVELRSAARDIDAQVVVFDPGLDLAVLHAPGLAMPALAWSEHDPTRGDVGAVLGHPEGGALAVVPASVLEGVEAVGRDIYDAATVTRTVVVLQALILPGDSGGPFVLSDGRIGGIVFARSIDEVGVGYAIAPSAAAGVVASGVLATAPVSTGTCAAP